MFSNSSRPVGRVSSSYERALVERGFVRIQVTKATSAYDRLSSGTGTREDLLVYSGFEPGMSREAFLCKHGVLV